MTMRAFMTFNDIVRILEYVPHMPPECGKLIYEFVIHEKPERILELGFAHGTSSCYIAAALQENGGGELLTIDHERAKQRDPNIFSLLEQTGLGAYVTPVFCKRSYTWELMKLIESHTDDGVTTPVFDFVFIDGGHTWDSDGFSFLLADRLLKPGGWVLFDDVNWKPSFMEGEDWLNEMPEEERNVAHVEKIVSLLLVPHPSYAEFAYDGTWAWARKKTDTAVSDSKSSIVKDIYRKTQRTRRTQYYRRILKQIFHV
jgi:predicted O-methyltransferase YrrM